MRQKIEPALLDWSRNKNMRIQGRGIAALVAQKAKIIENTKAAGTTRCVWPDSSANSGSRYLSRRIWMS